MKTTVPLVALMAFLMFTLAAAFTAPAAAPPIINSFSPAFGPTGTVVTINGQNFQAGPTNNIVFFGAVRATILTAAPNSLTVKVPPGATAPLTVTTSNLTAAANAPFAVTFNSPQAIGTNAFQPRVDFNSPLNPYGLVIGDWDGDGKPDIATIGAGVAKLSVFQNTTTGTVLNASSFAAKVDFSTGGTPRGVAFGDLDGDGKLDLVTANNGPDTISVFRNTSTNGVINASSFAARVDFGVGNAPYAVAIRDLDGDGRPDVVTANGNSDSISILRNTTTNGVIAFAVKVDLAVGNNPRKVALADLDGDGKPEILVANTSGLTLSVFQNQATNGAINTNSFAARVDVPIASAWDVDVGDVDGDGKPDVVVSGGTDHTLSILRNLMAGGPITTNSFAPRIDFTVGSGSGDQGEAEIIDVDGDGKPDVVAASKPSDALYVFRNLGLPGDLTTNSFAPAVIFSSGNGAYGVAAGDLDGDGRPDIATSDLNSDNISLHKNSVPIIPVVISSFTPTSGIGGSAISIFGTNLDRAMTVLLNGAGVDFSVISSTQLNLTTPICGASSGPVSITTLGGMVTSTNIFTVIVSPVVTGTNAFNLEAAMCGGGWVTFAVDGTITVTNTETILSDTTLDGTGHNVTISGGNGVEIFFVSPGVHLTLKNLTIANGRSAGGGGGLYNCAGIVTVDHCTFSNNVAAGYTGSSTGSGGAIYNVGTLTLNNSAFIANQARGANGTNGGNGAGQYAAGGNGGNGGTGTGGAICNDGGSLGVTNCTFYNNQAIGGNGGNGGNGYNGYTYTICCAHDAFGNCIQHCPVYVYGGRGGNGGNGGNAWGGNIYDVFGDAALVNVTFANGSASGGGQGYPGINGTLYSGGSGLSGTNGSGAGGNVYEATDSPVLKNTIVANAAAGGNYTGGYIIDAGGNLSSDATLPLTSPTSFTNTNPHLGPLTNNGGDTLTMALLPGSPAVRSGTTNGAPLTDQRGQPRKTMLIDIGAYETPVTPSVIPPALTATKALGADPFNLTFTNTPGTSFSVWVTTNLTVPMNSWSFGGFVREIAPGQFQYNAPNAPNTPQSYYRISSP